MNIQPHHVEKFKGIYRQAFGEEINDEEALEQCLKLVLLVKIVYRPMAAGDYEKIIKALRTLKK